MLLAAWSIIAPSARGAETEERLAYLESRLDASRDAIHVWQDGWTTVYTGAAFAYAALALDAGNGDDRTVRALGAVRAALAATLLTARPHPGRFGAERIREMGGATARDQLAAAERTLVESARRASTMRSPARHLRNVLVNAGFGALVWVTGDKSDALPFALMGIAGGEALLWTSPQQPRRDLAEYKRKFSAGERLADRWDLAVVPGGIRVQIAIGP